MVEKKNDKGKNVLIFSVVCTKENGMFLIYRANYEAVMS